jgi:MATE family multidrug resistance protein
MMQIISNKFNSELLLEARANLRLAIPSATSQLAEVGINSVNVVMMGLLGTQSLAAGALGVFTFFTALYICAGTLEAVGANVAQAFGAGKTEQVCLIASQGLWLAAALSFPGMILLWQGEAILSLAGQEASNVLIATTYLRAIMWGFPAVLGFWTLKSIAAALNKPIFITFILVAGLLLDIPVSYALIFGKFGLPALGLAGIGWATTLVFWLQFLAGINLFIFHPSFREYKIFRYLHKFDKVLFVEVFQTGWPLGLQLGSETALFAVSVFIMGYFGTEILAAYEIAIQTAEFFLVMPLGIYYATLARVGQMVGKQDLSSVKRSAFVGFSFSVLFASSVALIVWLFPEKIVAIYLDSSNPENTKTVETAISFLDWAAVLQLFYSIQATAISALIGIKDTRLPMLLSVLINWGFGLSVCYITGFVFGWGATGIWLGLTLAPAIAGIIYIYRFYSVVPSQLASVQEDEESAQIHLEVVQ